MKLLKFIFVSVLATGFALSAHAQQSGITFGKRVDFNVGFEAQKFAQWIKDVTHADTVNLTSLRRLYVGPGGEMLIKFEVLLEISGNSYKGRCTASEFAENNRLRISGNDCKWWNGKTKVNLASFEEVTFYE